MTGCTVKWLIDELNKVEDKTRVVKVFESDYKAKDIQDAGTIREVLERYKEHEWPVIIYTWR
jgi:hypothetical protein